MRNGSPFFALPKSSSRHDFRRKPKGVTEREILVSSAKAWGESVNMQLMKASKHATSVQDAGQDGNVQRCQDAKTRKRCRTPGKQFAKNKYKVRENMHL